MSGDAAHRESQLTAAFVEIADNLVKDYDVADMLHTLSVRCVEIFGVSEAGIMLTGPDGELMAVASSSESAKTMDLLQLQTETGPCWEAVETGVPVHVSDLRAETSRWPVYVEKGLELGLRSIDAVPLRLREESVGALNLFRDTPGGLTTEDESAIQALADVATISLLQARHVEEAQNTADHLQIALDTRIAIEQAKGILSNSLHLNMSQSFEMLRRYSRSHSVKLTQVCSRLVEGELSPSDLT